MPPGQQWGHRGNRSLLAKVDQPRAGWAKGGLARLGLTGDVHCASSPDKALWTPATESCDAVIVAHDHLGTVGLGLLDQICIASSGVPIVPLSGLDRECSDWVHAGDHGCYCASASEEHLDSLPVRVAGVLHGHRLTHEQAQLRESSHRRTRGLTALREVAHTSSSTTSVRRMLQCVVDAVMDVVPGARGATARLLDENSGLLAPGASSDPDLDVL